MKIIYKKYEFWVLVLSSFLFFSSCKKHLQIDPPINQVTSDVVFSNDQTATASVVGLYSRFLNGVPDIFDGSISIFTSLSSDELLRNTPIPNEDQFYNNSLLNSNSLVYLFWSRLYTYIYHANACIEGLTKSNTLSDAVKNRLLGEVKFIRAFTYFYLVNLFGDVPLVTTTNYVVNAIMPRTPASEVYQQIVTDLLEAQNLLLATYPTLERIRANKWTATSLLARVYLYQKDYINAEIQAAAVINSGVYSIVQPLSNVFLFNSNEAIWQLKPLDPVLTSINTSEGRLFIPLPSNPNGKPAYSPTTNLYYAFEAGDNRKTTWINSRFIMSTNETLYYPYKYQKRSGLTTYNEYVVVFRLAEQYLIRAEARAQQNNISGAQTDLNVIRNRAGLGPTPANDKIAILSAIEQERRVELFAEWGHRWLDLKRTNRIEAVLSVTKGVIWQSKNNLYPLPIFELKLNTYLTQNPGY